MLDSPKESLRRHPMGFVLAVLSIAAGVATQAGVAASIRAAARVVRSEIDRLDPETLVVSPRSVAGPQGFAPLDTAIMEAIRDDAGAEAVIPLVRAAREVSHGRRRATASVIGTTPGWSAASRWRVRIGSFFDAADLRARSGVCVLGASLHRRLFEGERELGRVSVGSLACRVIGVLAPREGDQLILMPWTTMRSRLVGGEPQLLDAVMVRARTLEDVPRARRSVEATLLRRRVSREYVIDERSSALKVARTIQDRLQQWLVGSAALTLVAGGSAVAALLSVSARRRRREIAIRAALGATPFRVTCGFVSEGAAIAFLGGVVGIALGFSAAGWIAAALDWPVAICLNDGLFPLGAALLAGVGSAILPAVRASRVPPAVGLARD